MIHEKDAEYENPHKNPRIVSRKQKKQSKSWNMLSKPAYFLVL